MLNTCRNPWWCAVGARSRWRCFRRTPFWSCSGLSRPSPCQPPPWPRPGPAPSFSWAEFAPNIPAGAVQYLKQNILHVCSLSYCINLVKKFEIEIKTPPISTKIAVSFIILSNNIVVSKIKCKWFSVSSNNIRKHYLLLNSHIVSTIIVVLCFNIV